MLSLPKTVARRKYRGSCPKSYAIFLEKIMRIKCCKGQKTKSYGHLSSRKKSSIKNSNFIYPVKVA